MHIQLTLEIKNWFKSACSIYKKSKYRNIIFMMQLKQFCLNEWFQKINESVCSLDCMNQSNDSHSKRLLIYWTLLLN